MLASPTQRNGCSPDSLSEDEGDVVDPLIANRPDFTFSDDKHTGALTDKLQTFRRNRELCDVVFYVSDRELFAHRAVLAASSGVFYDMFVQRSADSTFATPRAVAANTPNGAQPHLPPHRASDSTVDYIEYPGVDFECFEALITFAYTSHLLVPRGKAAEMYKTAEMLRMETCARACASYLGQNLSVQNCIGIRKRANKANDQMLAAKVDGFIRDNMDAVARSSSEFMSLPCVKVQVIGGWSPSQPSAPVVTRVVDWLRQHEPVERDGVDFRIEHLALQEHLLYLDEGQALRDCRHADDSSTVGGSDLVQDYKAAQRRRRVTGGLSNLSGGRDSASDLSGHRHGTRFSSCDSLNSIASVASDADEVAWTLIAETKTSDSFSAALAVLRRHLVVLSVQFIEASERAGAVRLDHSPVAQSADDSAPLAAMTTARCSVGAVELGGRVVVCGGYDRGECLQSVEAFEPTTNAWSRLPPMTKERGRFAAVVCGERLFALGGSDGNNDLRSVECLPSAAADSWTPMAEMSVARSHHCCAAVDDSIYCIGGWNGQTVIKTCEKYSATDNCWTAVAPLMSPRYQAGCCAWDGRVVVLGGCDRWQCSNAVEMFDAATDQWLPLPAMATSRRGCGAVVCAGRLWAIGGSDGVQSLSSVESLNVATGVWTSGPPLLTPRANVGAVVVGGRIFAVGGFSGKHFLNTIEVLTPGSDAGWEDHHAPSLN